MEQHLENTEASLPTPIPMSEKEKKKKKKGRKSYQPRVLYIRKISFNDEGKIVIFFQIVKTEKISFNYPHYRNLNEIPLGKKKKKRLQTEI